MAVVKCPVCGEDISVDVGHGQSTTLEERYQHQDHYLYIDLPFLCGGIGPDEEGNPVRMLGLMREPKLLSNQTALFLAKKLGVLESDIREIVHEWLKNDNLESEAWGERLLLAIQSLVQRVEVNGIEQLVLEDLLFDEGITLSDSSLELHLEFIDGVKKRTRSHWLQILKDLYREFREVYSHYHMTLLAVRSEKGVFVLAAWIVLTPTQDLPEEETMGETQVLLKRTYKLDRLNDIIRQLERGRFEAGSVQVFVSGYRRGFWSDARGVNYLPQQMRHLSSDGYGVVFNTGKTIESVFEEIDVNLMEFIKEGDERFYAFEEFSQRWIGERFDTSRRVLVHILAPYWVNLRSHEIQDDGTVLVEWSCLTGCYGGLKPILRALRDDGWYTCRLADQAESTEDVHTLVKSVFSVPSMNEVGYLEFIIEHPVAFRIDNRRPYLMNIGFGNPNKRKEQPTTRFSEKTFLELLDDVESQGLERKPYLRWNSIKNKVDKNLEYEATEAVAAFMNSRGGVLIIGQDRQNQTIGIEQEYPYFPHKTKDREAFNMRLMEIIQNRISAQSIRLISVTFIEHQGHDICMVSVDPSSEPVFVKRGGNPNFVVRQGPRTIKLSSEEQYLYIRQHFHS